MAVLFYAQWCKNCHALAPVWDQISRILKAGTADSKLIVGLFDCEANEEHMDLCNEARIKHYPTIAYISLAGAGHRLSSSSRPYAHLIHYTANNWQVGEALMDWIRTLSALSQWHRAGWGHWIRSTLSPLGLVSSSQPKSSTALSALPVGAPKAMADTMELQNLRLDYNETLAVSIRSSAFVDALLFPILSPSDKALAATTNKNASTVPSTTLVSEGGKNYTDVYAMLHQTKAWQDSINSNNNNIMNYNTVMNQIIRTCVSEVSLDYCTRLSAQYMEAWVDSFLLQPHTKTLTNAMFDEFQVQLHEDLLVVEPFCAIMDNCTLVNFAAPQCQPETCPFADPVACRYLSACLTPQLQHEYSEALDLFPHQQQQYQTQQAPKSTTDSKKEPVKKGRGGSTWGL